MATVETWKRKGVLFKLGDKRLDSRGGILKMNACGVQRANESILDDKKEVVDFAWRDTEPLPENPELRIIFSVEELEDVEGPMSIRDFRELGVMGLPYVWKPHL